MAEDTQEAQKPRPLTSEEIKDAIAQTIAEKVRAALNTTCYLYGPSYPKFKCDLFRLPITLANMYDEESETFVNVAVPTHEVRDAEPVLVGGEIKDGLEVKVDVEIPYTPPNVVRRQHGMPIPTVVRRDDGSTEQKAVVFRRTKGRSGPESD